MRTQSSEKSPPNAVSSALRTTRSDFSLASFSILSESFLEVSSATRNFSLRELISSAETLFGSMSSAALSASAISSWESSDCLKSSSRSISSSSSSSDSSVSSFSFSGSFPSSVSSDSPSSDPASASGSSSSQGSEMRSSPSSPVSSEPSLPMSGNSKPSPEGTNADSFSPSAACPIFLFIAKLGY